MGRVPSIDEEEEGALAEEPEAECGEGEERQLLFPSLATFTPSSHPGCVFGSRDAVFLLRDLVETQINPPPPAEGAAPETEYYRQGLKNALATLTEYSQHFQVPVETFLAHLFAEHVLRPPKVAALKRLQFKETARNAGPPRNRTNDPKRPRRLPPPPPTTAEQEVPSTVVKWPPDSSLSDISSD